MAWWARLRSRAHELQTEAYALYLAARHPGTPWYAKLVVAAVAAYAFSPLDLIPDFVPVLGYLDDLVLLPLGILLAIKLVPAPVLADCRARAAEARRDGRPVSRAAAAAIVVVWLLLAACGVVILLQLWHPARPGGRS